MADVDALAGRRLPVQRAGREGRVDEPVGLRLERLDLLLAAGDDRERRRLHAPERDRAVEGAAQPDRRRARGVHADDPVGLRARARGLLEALELLRRAQRRERALHRRVRHRAQPQPFDRLLGFGLLVQVGEDQLALATGVAGVDDLLDVLAAELFGDHRHLLARALVAHLELEVLGHDRQVGHPPALVFRVVRFRFGELHEMPDGPRDHVLGTLEETLLLLERAGQHAREILPDGGLLGDQERLRHGGQRSGRQRDIVTRSHDAAGSPAVHGPVLARVALVRIGFAQHARDRFVGHAVAAAARGCRRSRRRPSSAPARRRRRSGPPELPGRTSPRSGVSSRETGPWP